MPKGNKDMSIGRVWMHQRKGLCFTVNKLYYLTCGIKVNVKHVMVTVHPSVHIDVLLQ